MPKVTVRLKLKLKDTVTEFKEGMGPGVLVTQDLVYDLTEEQAKSYRFQSDLYLQSRQFLDETVTVDIEIVGDA